MQKYLNVSQDKIISKGIKSISALVTKYSAILLANDITIDKNLCYLLINEFLAQRTPV